MPSDKIFYRILLKVFTASAKSDNSLIRPLDVLNIRPNPIQSQRNKKICNNIAVF